MIKELTLIPFLLPDFLKKCVKVSFNIDNCLFVDDSPITSSSFSFLRGSYGVSFKVS
jgi:hypothetical protein